MNVNAKVAMDKAKHPERYCPVKGCLWKTTKLNHETQKHEGGGLCPRHKKEVTTQARGWKNLFDKLAWEARDWDRESTEGRYGK